MREEVQEAREAYESPTIVELGQVAMVTLGATGICADNGHSQPPIGPDQ